MQGHSLNFDGPPKRKPGTGVFADSEPSEWDAIFAELERSEPEVRSSPCALSHIDLCYSTQRNLVLRYVKPAFFARSMPQRMLACIEHWEQ